MNKRCTTLFAGIAVAAIALATSGAAKATGCYGAFVIRNPSSGTIHYQIKWGDGSYRNYCLYARQRQTHYIPLDANGRAGQPYVRFDYIGGNGRFDERTNCVGFYAVHNPWNGKGYVFRYSRCGCYLSLYCD